ncbi:MAG: chemotaxis protein methyltransferase CheR [Chloroflexota bacterium]|jgi:chemotaxis protein methyltransferase CheR|nr:chemotaxis protein methyltransferase CheR [Chloroflexota bacterium]
MTRLDGAMHLAEAALERAIGLRPEAAMRGRLERCLVEAAAAAAAEVLDFAGRLTDGSPETQLLCDLVTVQESWFFREEAHFAALAAHLRGHCAGRPVTVWSAGCANGQEAYSLAMTLAESPVSSWRVMATDISTRALARTAAGRYSERELRGLDPRLRARHLRPVPGGFEVHPELRERVEVRRNSLTEDAPPGPPGGLEVIFCRNVLIYLRDQQAAALLARFAAHLAPGQLLFLASSDAGGSAPPGFEVVRLGDAFVHRRSGAGTAPAPRHRAAARPAPRTPRPQRVTPPPPAAALPDLRHLLAAGEAAAAAGDLERAIRSFRQAAFLAPNHGAAHASLGVALEAAGDAEAAARAFMAARAALARSLVAVDDRDLQGPDRGALAALLAARLEARR